MWCNLVVVLAAVSVTVAFPVEPLKGGEIDRWFVQKLDHFDLTNPKTWKQRYQVNGTWFKGSKSSPIMLYVEGEITIGPKNESVFLKHYGYLKKYAEEFGAICFVLEHRYYGESHPTEDLSVENLRFLTTQQALADVAQFIVGMNKLYQFQPTNRWILFGGSYAGSLVAWARLKYPHLVHAAVSSSPALISTVGQREYYEAVKETLASYNKSCAENFHQGALDIASLLKEPKGADIISKKFNLSESVDPKNPMDNFPSFFKILQPTKELVQFHGLVAVRLMCKVMVDKKHGSLIDRYAKINLISQYFNIPDLGDDIDKLSYSNESIRQWANQTCTELGRFDISSSEEFGSSLGLDSYISGCKGAFGDDFNLTRLEEGVQRTNAEYGGANISVSRVVFTYGTVDPWQAFGIRNSSDPDMPVIKIEGEAHCSDMGDFPPGGLSEAVKTARSQIMGLLGKWISE